MKTSWQSSQTSARGADRDPIRHRSIAMLIGGSAYSACYDCLKVYRNMTYHGLLDWRLAITYLKVLFDPDYRAGLNGDFSGSELSDWLETAARLRDSFISYFNYQPVIWGSLPGFTAGGRRFLVSPSTMEYSQSRRDPG